MAIQVKHTKVSTVPDDTDTSLVRPSDWNADHTLVGTIDVPNGGTGASTLTGYVKGNGTSAMTASATVPSTDITGLGTMSTQNANAVAITGGTINGTTIGATSATTGKFSTLEATGTSTLGTTSAQYIQAEGGATAVLLSAQGSGTNIPLALQPKGTGAIQAQATTSTTAGGNVRGANAVDWQTSRSTAAQVASGSNSFVGSGRNNTSNNQDCFVGAGFQNTASSSQCGVVSGARNQATNTATFIGGGYDNTANLNYGTVVGGQTNTASGFFGFVGNGFTNSTTSSSAVTTQSGTMNATTAVTLSGSNANIKVGQYITGTSIANQTYVAAISGTALTLSQAASGSSTSTLSFYTPHGVVVGGGNNQATGAYSAILGGGDAGTAANRNVASGDWSFVGGGYKNTASGLNSTINGGNNNTASGSASGVFSGNLNTSNNTNAFVGGGFSNTATGIYSCVLGGVNGTTRGIAGNQTFSACVNPIANAGGVSQAALLILAKQTTDATASALTSDGSAASTTNQVILPNNSAYYFKGSVIANVTGAANGAAWSIEGAIMRGANAASTVLIDTPSVNRVACSAGATAWVVAVTADTTNGGIAVTVTGVASTTIRWVAKLETTEVTF